VFLLKVILYFWFPCLTSISLSPCAKWNQEGIIIAGSNNQSGNGVNQLNKPGGIFFHKSSNILYIADSGNNRIQMVSFDQSPPTVSTIVSNVPYPMNIYVNDEGGQTILYIASIGEQAVVRWVKGESSGQVLKAECNYCFGVSVDQQGNIYTSGLTDLVSLTGYVNKWSPQTNISSKFATSLYAPTGIYMDQTTGSLYVSETTKSRILMLPINNSAGSTVAAFTSGGTGALDIMMPYGIRVDETTTFLYVADRARNTIRRWAGFDADIIIGISSF
jgi:sugar lactone lactonase YvrE